VSESGVPTRADSNERETGGPSGCFFSRFFLAAGCANGWVRDPIRPLLAAAWLFLAARFAAAFSPLPSSLSSLSSCIDAKISSPRGDGSPPPIPAKSEPAAEAFVSGAFAAR